MVLNVAALTVLGLAPVAAGLLLRRHLPRIAATRDPVCLRCGAPASVLTSFTCPGCGHDVREAGLGRARGPTPLSAFWLVVVFSLAFVLAATVGGNLLYNVLPTIHRVSRNTSVTLSSPRIRGVGLYLDTIGPGDGRQTGTLTGDLFGSRGLVILEVDVPPGRWRLLDPSGKTLGEGGRLDGNVVLHWMESAGAQADGPGGYSDAAHIARALESLLGVELEMPPVPVTGRALSMSYSQSSGGGSFVAPDPRWVPALAIAAAAVWLAGVQLILLSQHPRPRRPRAEEAVQS